MLNGGLTIALVSDEETMGRWGAEWLLDSVPEVRGNACLIGEPGGTDVITLGEKSIWWFKLTVKGTSTCSVLCWGKRYLETVQCCRKTGETETRTGKNAT
jgi:acetylornithine deacetylase/succinyl-diaminopimelate desuccinylase-like protein